MSDKYEYWRELFGEEFPEGGAKEGNEHTGGMLPGGGGLPINPESDFNEESVRVDGIHDFADSKEGKGKKPSPANEKKIQSDMSELFGVKVAAGIDEGEKWAVFGGSSKKQTEKEIWFDVPGYKQKAESAVKRDELDTTNVIPEKKSEGSKDTKRHAKALSPVEEPTRMIESLEGGKPADDERIVVRGRNKRTGCLGGIMYFVFVAGLSIVLAGLLWLAASDVLALGKGYVSAVITVDKDFTIDEIADDLSEAGIIKYKFLFKLYAAFSNAEDNIDPGTYELSTNFDYRALVVKMQAGSGSQLTTEVMIPEGYTLKQIFTLLDDKLVCDYEDLVDTAASYAFKHEFLQDIPIGEATRLEGYLFPDTYEFYVGDNSVGVINKMLNNFDNKVTDEMYAQAEALGYTMHDIVKMASLIEKEAANDSERPTIASVIYNRLNNWDNPLLQIDATVQYALPERKENLSLDDLEIDSPYNTYKYAGLPIGPIANPGLASLKAVLEPAETNYYYYLLNITGVHSFFRYHDDFEAFKHSENFAG